MAMIFRNRRQIGAIEEPQLAKAAGCHYFCRSSIELAIALLSHRIVFLEGNGVWAEPLRPKLAQNATAGHLCRR